MSVLGTLLIIISFILNRHCSAITASEYGENSHKACPRSSYEELCLLPACIEEAASILKNMNKYVDPCDNFYEFVCGNFLKEEVVPDNIVTIDMFYITQQNLRSDLRNDIKANIETNDLLSTKKFKTFYQNCKNISRIEKENVEPVLKLIKKLGGWPVLLGDDWNENDYQWDETITKINEAGLEPIFPVKLAIERDSLDSKKKIVVIRATRTTVNNAYFFKGNKNIDALKAYMVDIAVMLGATQDNAEMEMGDCLDFEIKLYKIKTQIQSIVDISKVENRTSIKDFTQKYDKIFWLNILNRILNPSEISINENEKIEIRDLKYITEITQLINNTQKRVLANYQIWQQIAMLIDYMPSKFDERKLLFKSIAENVGIKAHKNTRETRCADKVTDIFQVAVSAMYVRKYFNKRIMDNVNSIVQNIKYQVKENLERIDWMDKDTREFAIEKLNAMDSLVAYPDELLDDKKVDQIFQNLDIELGSYIDSFINVTKFIKNLKFKKLRDSANDWIKDAKVATIDVRYSDGRNKIILPAGILRNHFYNIERPGYLNYGAIGSAIAHEITHAFDMEGRYTDKNGDYKNWWQESTVEKFKEKSKCMIDQYDNFTVLQDGVKMDGKHYLSENIAENGGVKLAYLAYKKWISDNNIYEKRLPALNYTPEQMYWISAASRLCSEMTDGFRSLIKSHVHNTNGAKVRVIFSNNENFARDFKCELGSKMNPINKCHLW